MVMTDLMTSAEAADYLRVSDATLRRWRMQGRSPPYSKIGSKPMYRRAILDDWIEGRQVTNTQQEAG